jgi:hypothetical protein
MNRYSNSYGRQKPKSIIREDKQETYIDQDQEMPEYIQQPVVRKYLPGEKLLKKLNEVKKKPLNLKILEKSLSEVLSSF